jgi:hypothetical protein
MTKRILLLTDSLSLPRSKPEICSLEQTYPELLRSANYTVCTVAIGGANSADLLKQIFYFEGMTFDYIFIQSGIVDCTPRFLKRTELKILRSIPFIGNRIIGLLNKNWIRNFRNITYTPPKKYEQHIQKFITGFPKQKVYFIGILPANEAYEQAVKNVTNRINQYNLILSNTGNYISMENIPNAGIMSDHHHLTAAGHVYIFESIKKLIN